MNTAFPGCTLPPLLVARTCNSCTPADNFTGKVHSRKEYLPRSLPSFAAFQVLPPSVEPSTCLMPVPPSNAMPLRVRSPDFSFVPFATLVLNERTVKRLIGTVAFGAVPGSTQAHSLSGMRYAVFIQKLSYTLSMTVISLRCLTQ